MTTSGLEHNAVNFTECCSNLFKLADINGLKWCKYTGSPCSLDRPLDDPVLGSFATALEQNVLCAWRHAPPTSGQQLSQNITCSESAKELWLFWYGDDPRTINIVDKNLKESDHGSWESGFPNEAKVLLFKAFHNTLERHMLSRNYVRVGKWFVQMDGKVTTENSEQLFFSFSFCLQDNKIFMTVDVKYLPGVRHLASSDLIQASSDQGSFKVILGPYGISAILTGHSYQLNGVGVSKLVEEWQCFYPLNVVDDWSNVSEGVDHDVPVVVGVMVGDNFIKYPAHYVLISLEDEMTSECSNKTPFTPNSLNSPRFPMTPPASPFPTSNSDKSKSSGVTVGVGEREKSQATQSTVGKETDVKQVTYELVNNTWKDIIATKSATKSSGVGSSQAKSFSSTYKSDQEGLWSFKEPLSRKSCSCTSSSNISRSRVPTPGARSFNINRPSPSPTGQNNQSALANKLKKEKEKKPILPFHHRPTKYQKVGAVTKGLPTCNLKTHVSDQNRQPVSYQVKEKPVLTPKSAEAPTPEQPTPTLPTVDINANNNNDVHFKQQPPVPTRLSKAVRAIGDHNRIPADTDKSKGYLRTSAKSKSNAWQCYNVFTGDPKLKPRLPDDVLDLRDGQRLPLTTQNVVTIPEDTKEVFAIETVKNENYQNKRSPLPEPVAVEVIPPKRRRASSSSNQSSSSRPKSDNTTMPKSRSSRSNSATKTPVPTPSPDITLPPSEVTTDKDQAPPVPTPPPSRTQDGTTNGPVAGSPAPSTTSKSRSAKNRRAHRKSQDRKTKETASVKQEQPAEPISTLLASPPTPKSCVSLKTEKDLQVTFSDLDKLFDSADEEEEENKLREPKHRQGDHSPSHHHGNDDAHTKNTKQNSGNNAPGIVPLTDLVRMFPTPPSLENHQLSPSTSATTDHYYTSSTTAPCALTPPEVIGHTTLAYNDVAKHEQEERNQILASIKELPPIFEVPNLQDFVSATSMFSPVKSLPSSKLPAINMKDNSIYQPTTTRHKGVGGQSESTSLFGGLLSLGTRSAMNQPVCEASQGLSLLNPNSQKINFTSSPREMFLDRPKTKYTPLGDRDSNLLNANLFLSDTYLNYLPDRNLDCLDACVCVVDDRKALLRQQLTMNKEPISYQKNADTCTCGLRTFERERLKLYGGLFPGDEPAVVSCMNTLGVVVDTRYVPTTGNVLSVKGEPAKLKDLKACQNSPELLHTPNSSVLLEFLMKQFSSPLSASAVTESFVVATKSAEDHEKSQFKPDDDSFSKDVVDFLINLKPVIQESLHKAIRWKTWEQQFSVQGPLSLKDICSTNSKVSLRASEAATIPGVMVGHDNDWLSVSPLALQYWEKLSFEPYTSQRDVMYVVVAPDNEAVMHNVKLFFKELSAIYETCLLGHHVPMTTKLPSISNGVLKIGQNSVNKYGKNTVGSWFAKYDNSVDGPRIKLFAQVCKYELRHILEKVAKDRLVVSKDKDDSSNARNPSDQRTAFITNDCELPGLRDDDSQAATVVVYIVNPFDEAEDPILRAESYFGLLRAFTEMAASLTPVVRNRLVLEVVPSRHVTQVDAYQKTKGSQMSFVKLLKTTAFSVFSRCRVVVQVPRASRTHTGFWATPSQKALKNSQLQDASMISVYSPAFVLATPNKLIHRVDTVKTPNELSLHKESSNLLFCCYGLSVDHRWLLAICTNDTGLIIETFVTVVEPAITTVTKRRTRLRVKALTRLWEFCRGVTSCIVTQWRLVIGKLGRFTCNELKDWDEIIRTQSSAENSKQCNACSSNRCHANFQSVSLVSLQNDLCLRIHLAKVSSPFTSYREPSTSVVESVSRPRFSTSYIVINTESSPTSVMSAIDDMDSARSRVDSDLLMTEQQAEDDDDMPMMPLFGSIANILPPAKPSPLQRCMSLHDRPSSAPLLSDPVTSTFVPISAQCSQQRHGDDGEQDKQFGLPLAHGRVFTTAPLGPVFKNFTRHKAMDADTPVVLKASLLAHHVEVCDQPVNHVLSSTTHASVLRCILEHYDALSWLSVDAVSKDRISCLPIHYTALSQMTHAFDVLLQ